MGPLVMPSLVALDCALPSRVLLNWFGLAVKITKKNSLN